MEGTEEGWLVVVGLLHGTARGQRVELGLLLAADVAVVLADEGEGLVERHLEELVVGAREIGALTRAAKAVVGHHGEDAPLDGGPPEAGEHAQVSVALVDRDEQLAVVEAALLGVVAP